MRQAAMYATAMYETAMGERFARLAEVVQKFHRLHGHHVLHGEVTVHAPASTLAYLVARFLGTPLVAEEGPIKFELDAGPSSETWTLHFPSSVLTSTLQVDGTDLVEKVGAARLTFALSEHMGQLRLTLQQLHFFGVRCPAWLMPIIVADESGIDNRLHFDIRVEMRYIGVVAQYHGYLLLPAGDAE
jgi:hypothetical protein